MPLINAPIKENATEKFENLSVSWAINQQYTFATFEFSAAKKAYSMVWKNAT
jgi:hypothetical protein